MKKKLVKKSKLINISEEENKELEKIRDEIRSGNGYISINQLIRDSIRIMLQDYRDEVIRKYLPIRNMGG